VYRGELFGLGYCFADSRMLIIDRAVSGIIADLNVLKKYHLDFYT
jgi:hypothetical protein